MLVINYYMGIKGYRNVFSRQTSPPGSSPKWRGETPASSNASLECSRWTPPPFGGGRVGVSSTQMKKQTCETWVTLFPALAGLSCYVITCSCEAEVPFGRAVPRFFVRVVGFGSVCCFRFKREAKRNGGGFCVSSCACGVRKCGGFAANLPKICEIWKYYLQKIVKIFSI